MIVFCLFEYNDYDEQTRPSNKLLASLPTVTSLDLLNKYNTAASFDIPVYATAVVLCYPDTETWHDATTTATAKSKATTSGTGLIELKNKMSALLSDVLNDITIASSSGTSVYDVLSVPICVYRYICRLVEVCTTVCDGSDTAGYIMCKGIIDKHIDTPLGPLVSTC
jgi:hypothetical protein